jgi:hypothetical protein
MSVGTYFVTGKKLMVIHFMIPTKGYRWPVVSIRTLIIFDATPLIFFISFDELGFGLLFFSPISGRITGLLLPMSGRNEKSGSVSV